MADDMNDHTGAEREAAARAAFVSGLRQLAAFVESNPELPLPMSGSHNAFVNTKAELAAIVRFAGVKWDKAPIGNYFCLSAAFDGGHSYDVNVQRDQVCKKVVTGTRIEPATPEREVETYEWICDEPLLAGAR